MDVDKCAEERKAMKSHSLSRQKQSCKQRASVAAGLIVHWGPR